VTAVECHRDSFVDAIAMFLAREHAPGLDEIKACVERAIDEAGPGALTELGARLAAAGTDWDYYPKDALARRIHHLLASRVLTHEPAVEGIEHLAGLGDRPLVIVANHLSYSDANAIEVLLHRAGAAELSDRLTVVAGPKVYSNVRRRFSSLCFGTVKVPQSGGVATEEAVMNARDAARAARRAIEVARARLRAGEALLVFAEGSRSRSGGMQPLLPGVARYIDVPGARVLPVGLTGTERLFPIADEELRPVRLTMRIGRALAADALFERAQGDRRHVMDAIGFAIAALLPPAYRGVYARNVDMR
jgi:1-acyl-sn-glycerol-3-phosphate acyltransferase